MNPGMKSRPFGFTLMELSLALAAGAVILLAIYGVFSRAVHLRDAATERTREIRVRTHVANVIRNDLRGARISGGSLAASLTGSVQGQTGTFPGYLRFTTTTARDLDYGDDVANADVQEVEYYVTTDPGAQDTRAGLLVRTVDGNLLAPVRTTPPEQPLLPGIESMEVTFFDGNTWQDSWDAAQGDTTMPQAVRVRLQPVAAVVNGKKPPVIEVLVPWVTQLANPTTSAPLAPAGGGGAKTPAPKTPATGGTHPPPSTGGTSPR